VPQYDFALKHFPWKLLTSLRISVGTFAFWYIVFITKDVVVPYELTG
jgi:hypothetical protein